MTDHNNLTDDECKKVLTNLIKRFESLYSNNSNHENIIEELADLMSCGLIGDIPENKLQNSFQHGGISLEEMLIPVLRMKGIAK